MTDKLFQKHAIKGKRSFELVDDAVNVTIDMPFLSKEYTVVLSSLDPKPVVEGSVLAFVSAVNREPLIEMFIDRPDPASFSAFVEEVKRRALEEDFGKPVTGHAERRVDVGQLQIAIDMLTTYLAGDEYAPFLGSLAALKEAPQDRAKLDAMFTAFNDLGPMQGAVLTYAPYVTSLLTGDIPDSGPPED